MPEEDSIGTPKKLFEASLDKGERKAGVGEKCADQHLISTGRESPRQRQSFEALCMIRARRSITVMHVELVARTVRY